MPVTHADPVAESFNLVDLIAGRLAHTREQRLVVPRDVEASGPEGARVDQVRIGELDVGLPDPDRDNGPRSAASFLIWSSSGKKTILSLIAKRLPSTISMARVYLRGV